MKVGAVSVVVPLYDEADNVQPLLGRLEQALDAVGARWWEIVLVDDGSTDDTLARCRAAAREDRRVRVMALARNYGQTTALQAGFDGARGDVVVTMDGDLQNDPADIGRLLDEIEAGHDLVVGYRVRRQDAFVMRKIPSWVANRIIRWMTGVRVRDVGCALKAYRRELLDRMHLYSDMHRFIPALAAAGGARITEIPVRHHPRVAGVSKYGPGRVWRVLADLLTIRMIQAYADRPLALFAPPAIVAFAAAIAAGAAAIAAAVGLQSWIASAVVLPGVALLAFGLGVFLLMVGLTAEVFLRTELAVAPRPLPVVRDASA
ncbi:MAG TPA: glycosyltransferase family 2 protein [Longimicrobiales bacterium]|nr:glycosyltransferase family 2 protein [Longimicrobiales bacterium]